VRAQTNFVALVPVRSVVVLRRAAWPDRGSALVRRVPVPRRAVEPESAPLLILPHRPMVVVEGVAALVPVRSVVVLRPSVEPGFPPLVLQPRPGPTRETSHAPYVLSDCSYRASPDAPQARRSSLALAGHPLDTQPDLVHRTP
jgi:hypothetical protein